MGVIDDLRGIVYRWPVGLRRFIVQFPLMLLIGELWFGLVSKYLGLGPEVLIANAIPFRYVYGLLFLLGLFFIRDKGRGGI